MNVRSILGISLLSGTIIGAGTFSLPYIFSQIGIFAGFIYLLFFACMYIGVYFMYSSLLLKEKEQHDFFFLAKKHLPAYMLPVVVVTTIGGLIFGLLTYLTLIPSFISFAFGIEGWAVIFLFWIVCSVFVFVRVDALGWAEFLGTASIVGAIFFIAIFACVTSPSSSVQFSHRGMLSLPLFLIPFGPILFSFSGRSAVSQVVKTWREGKSEKEPFSLRKTIAGGVILPAVVYGVFVLAVIFLSPHSVSEDALSGLVLLPLYAKIILAAVGFLALWTSYIVLINNVKDIFLRDMHFSRIVSFGAPIILPPLLLLLGLDNFMEVIGITGGIFVALEGLFIVWMWLRAFPHHALRRYAYVPAGIFIVSFLYACTEFLI